MGTSRGNRQSGRAKANGSAAAGSARRSTAHVCDVPLLVGGWRTVGFVALITFAIYGSAVAGVGRPIHGATAIVTLVAVRRLVGWLRIRSIQVQRVLDRPSVILIDHGRLIPKALRRAHLTDTEVYAFFRQHDIDQLDAADLLVLEGDGRFSVLRCNDLALDRRLIPARSNMARRQRPDLAPHALRDHATAGRRRAGSGGREAARLFERSRARLWAGRHLHRGVRRPPTPAPRELPAGLYPCAPARGGDHARRDRRTVTSPSGASDGPVPAR